MTEEQQKRLDVAIAWRDKGAVSVQFDTAEGSEHKVTHVQFHSEVVRQPQSEKG